MSTASWICSKSKAYKLASHGRRNSEQAPRYTVQGCQCEGQGSLDVLREAQLDGMQSCDKEGARLGFKSLALPTQKRLRCRIEYAQMLACLLPLTEQCCYGLKTKLTVKSMYSAQPYAD